MITITKRTASRYLSLLSLVAGLSACSLFESESLEGKVVEAIPTLNPTGVLAGRCGNESSYRIGRHVVKVLGTSAGYEERGVATQYLSEQQDATTAGCEHYDGSTYSAAHRTLPIPSNARVTRLDTGRSVIVRINDRIPNDERALIQVSYAAAQALGMASDQSALVKVEGLDKTTSDSAESLYIAPSMGLTNSNKSVTPSMKAQAMGKLFYIIVGSYPTQAEAVDIFVQLSSAGIGKSELVTASHQGGMVHQVRVGPFYTQGEIDNVKNTLESNGLATFRVIGING